MKFGIIGAGGWGTALSCVLAENGFHPLIWAYEVETTNDININRSNSVFLPGIKLHSSIRATSSLDELNSCDTLLLSTPTQNIRSVVSSAPELFKNKRIINVAKGIEIGTMYRVSQILQDVCSIAPDNYAVLTGPSHAEEVARKIPTTIVIASENSVYAQEIQTAFNNSYFRVYTSNDIIGCEIGGALKNVIAVAAGVIDGAGFGDNTKAALITRGLAEMTRLGVAMGAMQNTFFGLSGIGDLFVTCASKLSRNRQVGEQIGKGIPLAEIFKNMKMVAEGVHTTQSAFELSKKHNVEMPITEQMHKILFENTSALDSMKELMARKSKSEWL